ncbi:MAG: glycosyltransferase [Lewinellaceae bacterium]|nr:glycosyltransferase [Lewinellaceae bacterium]
MLKNLNIIFISPSIPRENSKSSDIVIYRHLEKLQKKGNNIFLITFEDGLRIKTPPKEWTVISLPNHKWWFPPFRNYKLLKLIRYWIYFLFFSNNIIRKKKPDVILGYLWGTTLSGFDAFISRRLNVPLCLFYHDDQKEFNIKKDATNIFNHEYQVVKNASALFTVSEKLIFCPNEFKNKHILLPPIPEGYRNLKKDCYDNRKIIYSGLVQESHIGIFNEISSIISNSGWELEVITSGDSLKSFFDNQENRFSFRPFFEKTKDAIDYISQNAGALLVGYPINSISQGQAWMLKSFPSKFTEYIHLGIPIIAIAPENSAFGEWCKKYKWPLYSNTTTSISSMINKLSNPQYWQEQSSICIETGNNLFSPDKIQEIFEMGIESVLRSK